MNTEKLIDFIFPDANMLPSVDEIERQFAHRGLGDGAIVTRFAPSPTGFMHIGGIYAALINKRLAQQSKGVFYLRIEDTDTARSQTDSIQTIIEMLDRFDLSPDEGVVYCNGELRESGLYGPYIQSSRRNIYRVYVRELVRKGLAYPCFLSASDLDAMRQKQTELKVRPGCYGKWARWRDAYSYEIEAKIREKANFVIRLKAVGSYSERIEWKDLVKGDISMPENDIDVVLLKSDGLPTYHFAHIVDDYLMKTTHVVRGDEWLSSVPLHLQLFNLFGWEAPKYAHFSPIEKEDRLNGYVSRRKLSKRKDDEANVLFYLQQGFPEEAIIIYLQSLLDSSFLEWHHSNPGKEIENFLCSLNKLSKHGALSDILRLKNISRDMIARLDINTLYEKATSWACKWDKKLGVLMKLYPEYTKQVLDIERHGERASRRFTTLADISKQIFFMYDELFYKHEMPCLPENINTPDIESILIDFKKEYQSEWDKENWLSYLKNLSMRYGYADSVKKFRTDHAGYKGHFGDIAMLLRIVICGVTQSPDLWEVMRILGYRRIISRVETYLAK